MSASTSTNTIAVIIPAYKPSRDILTLVRELLHTGGFPLVIVVDDGSGPAYYPLFEALHRSGGCVVLHHSINHGQGYAIKTGMRYFLRQFDFAGVITFDCDGQHSVKDAVRVAYMVDWYQSQPMVLGVRSLSLFNRYVPLRSSLGRLIGSLLLFLRHGIHVSDTQSGLRGYPRNLIPEILAVRGDGFDWNTNTLIHLGHDRITETPMDTIYLDGNRGSHFSTLRDSWRIIRTILRGRQ